MTNVTGTVLSFYAGFPRRRIEVDPTSVVSTGLAVQADAAVRRFVWLTRPSLNFSYRPGTVVETHYFLLFVYATEAGARQQPRMAP